MPTSGLNSVTTNVIGEIIEAFSDDIGDSPVGLTIPAPVVHGRVPFIANLDQKWAGLEADKYFEDQLGRKITLVNDADAAGLAEVHFGAAKGHTGLVILTTLGTGIGSAMIYRGVLIPNAELGHVELAGYDVLTSALSGRDRGVALVARDTRLPVGEPTFPAGPRVVRARIGEATVLGVYGAASDPVRYGSRAQRDRKRAWLREFVALVDAECRTDDPDIHAIGDCAQTGRGCQGLVGPGWEQARVLAHHLAERIGGRRRPRPTLGFDGGVVRLKADGIEAVSMGEFPVDEFALGAPRVLGLVDAAGRRRVRIAVADGVLVGATCVGDPQAAADLTVAFDARTPVPDDPAALLARPLAGAAPAASVLELPDEAVVCRCNAVSKGTIAAAVGEGASTHQAVAEATRASTGCGSCTGDVCRLIETLIAARVEENPPGELPDEGAAVA